MDITSTLYRPTLIAAEHAHPAPQPLVAEGFREDARPQSGDASWNSARWWGVVLLAWTILGATAALQQAAMYATRNALGKEWVWVLMQVPRWLLWAPFTPVIFAAIRRFPMTGERIGRSILAHMALAAMVIVFVEGTYAQMSLVVEKLVGSTIAPDRPPVMALTLISIMTRLVSGIVTYAAVMGIATAIHSEHRVRERETRAANLEADLARAQVQAIKMQVQPHFLFNTLHAINVLIREDPAVATRMVTLLGDLLRQTLSRATVTKVSLRNELEVLTLYLEIEGVRFRDRLKVEFDVPAETLVALVPDLVLQPLAENAIKHGIGTKTEGGTVRICARRDGPHLVLEVHDTGDGPANGEGSESAAARERIGLSTVRTRLERLYGADQSLTLSRGPGGGCVARISLPFEQA